MVGMNFLKNLFQKTGLSVGWTWWFREDGYTNPEVKMGNFKYFSDQELLGLKDNLPAMLDMARGISGVPYIITFSTGGQHCPHSAHYDGKAVDLGLGHMVEGAERDGYRFDMLKGLFEAGFQRIEICPLHIHVDIGDPPEYPSPCCWIGTDS